VASAVSTRRRLAELLLACTTEHDWNRPLPRAVELADGLAAERVVEAAGYHRVVGCVSASLQGSDAEPDLLASLAAASRRTSGRTMLATAALRSVRDALGADVDWLVVKGPILDAVFYPRPRLRSFTDLDVLVAPSQLEATVELLVAAGYVLADSNWQLIRDRVAGELHLQKEGCAPVDLHWTLLFNEHLRQVFRFDTAAMIGRARTFEVAGGPVRTFDAVDTVLHLAVHAALEGGDRLVWLKDIDVAVRAGVPWDELSARAHDARVQLPVAALLARTARALGTPLPDDLLARLAPRNWRTLTAAADAAFPAARSTGVGSPATLLARSARDSVAATLGGAARGFARRAGALATGTVRRADHRSDAGHESSLRHPRGGAAERDEYFRLVAKR
jgi:hypothetical protein